MTTDEPTIQFLDPSGTFHENAANEPYLELATGIGPERLREMYTHMAVMRRLDREAAALQRQGQMALWVPSLGQEGAQIGAAYALAPQDWVFPSYREHLVGRVRGVPLIQIVNMLRGNSHGGWDWRATHFHLYTLVIGSHALHATGYAMGLDLDGVVGTGDPAVDSATIAFIGDGAMSQGDVSEALVFSTSAQAPVVFFCQNNGWAISVPVARQTRAPFSARARGFGMPGVRIDGNDPLASYAVTSASLDLARAGEGPAFVEAMTYRMGPHTSSDDPTKYRTREEEERWAALDPIPRLAAYLRTMEWADDDLFSATEQQAEDEAADLRARVTALPEPQPASMFAHVYSEPHPVMEAEAAWLEAYEAELNAEAEGEPR